MPSEDFRAFYYSCFDTSFGSIHDGLNIEALSRLRGEERAEAERLILRSVEVDIDPRPIRAAGYMKLQSASIILKDRLASPIDNGRNYNRVHIAWALYQIEQYSEAARLIVSVLRAAPRYDQWSRMMAVEALADFEKDPLAVSTLFDTVLDEDRFIAYLATGSLKRMFRSDRRVAAILNEILLQQSGHMPADGHTNIIKDRDKARLLVTKARAQRGLHRL